MLKFYNNDTIRNPYCNVQNHKNSFYNSARYNTHFSGYNFQFHFLHNLLVLGGFYPASFHLLSYPYYLSYRHYTMSFVHAKRIYALSLRGDAHDLLWKFFSLRSKANQRWYNIFRYYTTKIQQKKVFLQFCRINCKKNTSFYGSVPLFLILILRNQSLWTHGLH